jgi:hypothetical protein
MKYNPQVFLYAKDNALILEKEVEVPITENTSMGELVLAYSKQKLLYGRTTPEKILNLCEYELCGKV